MKIFFYELETDYQAKLKRAFPKQTIFCTKLAFNPQQLPAKDCEVISIHASSKIDDLVLDRLPALKLIITRTAGFDHIDLVACAKRNITVCNIPGQNAIAVAEHVFGMILNACRFISSSSQAVKNGKFNDDPYVGTELYGKAIGIVGAGAIGGHVARIASGFGLNVLAWDLKKNLELVKKYKVKYTNLNSLLGSSDFVSLHVPATPETEHMFDEDLFSKFKPGAVLINTARGSLINPLALKKALRSGQIARALLDVVDDELAISKHSVLGLKPRERKHYKAMKSLIENNKSVLVTPHVAHATHEAVERIFQKTLETLQNYLSGKDLSNQVMPRKF